MKNTIILCTLLISSLCISCKDDTKELIADFSASKALVLAGESIDFFDTSVGQPSSWNWTFPGGTPEQSNLSGPSVTYTTPGTYAVTMEIRNADGATQLTKESFITVDYNELTVDFEVAKTSLLEGEIASFTDKTTGLPTSWLWTFTDQAGVSQTSSDQNPQMLFTEGLYSVTLTASNPKYNGTASRNDYINVLDPTKVDANFTSDYLASYTGGKVRFTDTSIGLAESYEWTFEGGTPATSTEQNPVVEYTQAGRYKVSLRAYNDKNTSTKEIEDYILVVPGNGLTAFYPFDGSIDDAGPNKMLSSLAEGANITYTGSRRTDNGNTAVFNASGGFTVANNEAFDFGTGDYTVSSWVNTSHKKQMMLWMEGGNTGGENQTWVRLYSNATRFMSFNLEGSMMHVTDNKANIADGTWHHIVCVREGMETRLYIDGMQPAGSPKAATSLIAASNDQPFKVGMQQTNTAFSNKYDGLMDDLIVYKRALTEQEIQELSEL